MQETLVIYLHSIQQDQPGWAVVAEDGVVRQHAYRDEPEGLAALATDKEVIVIVPAFDVLLTSVTLPKMARARLMQALPYAVEDQLIDDVESLHFAVGEHRADGQILVAVLAKARMQFYLDLLSRWQIQPTVMMPAQYAVPAQENEWQVFLDEAALVRISADQGFGCDLPNLAPMLSLSLAAMSALPTSINVSNYSEEVVSLGSLPVPVVANNLPRQDFMTAVALAAVKPAPINLLQGPYAVKKAAFPRMDKMWTIIAYLSVVWVGLLFVYPLGSYLILKQKLSNLDDQISVIYKRNFPQSASVIAPKIRLEEKLQKLRAQQGENRLLVLLAYVGEGMRAANMIKLKQLEFQSGQLTLTLTAGSSDDFSAFTESLTQKGLQVRQQNATLDGEHINAVLQVE